MSNCKVRWKEKRKSFEISTTINGELFGPQVKFEKRAGKVRFETLSSGNPIGTSYGWLDTGDKFYERYFSVGVQGLIVCDSVGRFFSVDVLDESGYCIDGWYAKQIPASTRPRGAGASTRPLLYDPNAERDWCTADEELLEKLRFPLWENGQTAMLGNWDRYPVGPTITFWDNGMVRTVADWSDNCINGTRSCFDRSGKLVIEQAFYASGYARGCWVNRVFSWDDLTPSLARIDVYRDFELFEMHEEPRIDSILEEAFFCRFTDPTFMELAHRQIDPITFESKLGPKVQWEER